MELYDTGNRKDVRRAEKAAKLSQEDKVSAIAGIMSVSQGRHWMHDLLSSCNVFHTPFAGEDSATNFNCGVQSVGLRILSDIMQACPDDYIKMMREANERYHAAAERSRSQNGSGGDKGPDHPDYYHDTGEADPNDGYDFLDRTHTPGEERQQVSVERGNGKEG